MRDDVTEGKYFASFQATCVQKGPNLFYKGILLKSGGSMLIPLRCIRGALLQQMEERFANRGIVNQLSWLDVGQWPLNPSELATFAIVDIKAVYLHWARRHPQLKWANIFSEFDQVKTVFLQSPQPVNPELFWKNIIRNKSSIAYISALLLGSHPK